MAKVAAALWVGVTVEDALNTEKRARRARRISSGLFTALRREMCVSRVPANSTRGRAGLTSARPGLLRPKYLAVELTRN